MKRWRSADKFTQKRWVKPGARCGGLVLAVVGLALGLAACAAGPSHPTTARAQLQPELTPVNRLAQDTAAEYLVQQRGADFAADLSFNHCLPDGAAAKFTPAIDGDTGNPMHNAAFCIYRLALDAANTPVKLDLEWNESAPAEYWIGLADWDQQAWWWTAGTAGGEVILPEPARFATAEQHCCVALVVLGSQSAGLASIGFGKLPPPPPPPPGEGYTLFAPISDTTTYLLDATGAVVHTWASTHAPGMTVELTETGHLIRTCVLNFPGSGAGGFAGGLEEFDWEGNLVWSYMIMSPWHCSHHDFKRLPNGNLLVIVANLYAPWQMIAAGRDPSLLEVNGLWVDAIWEIEPVGYNQANIVWCWNTMDHLVQDFDPTRKNYGDPAAHPELLDVNHYEPTRAVDWMHSNCIDYNPALDQILLNVLGFSEFWIIDHSTTCAEAAGHSGGARGHGGDLIYRWGNPQNYRAGTAADRRLFVQHGSRWIPSGLPGAGNILLFNNQPGSPLGLEYSAVVEVKPALKSDGTYHLYPGTFSPTDFAWEYQATPREALYSPIMSSAQRLADGSTLVCSGIQSWFFELNPSRTVVWEYHNPFPDQLPGQVFRATRYPPDYSGLAALQ